MNFDVESFCSESSLRWCFDDGSRALSEFPRSCSIVYGLLEVLVNIQLVLVVDAAQGSDHCKWNYKHQHLVDGRLNNEIVHLTVNYYNYSIRVNEATLQLMTIVVAICCVVVDFHHAHGYDLGTNGLSNLFYFCKRKSSVNKNGQASVTVKSVIIWRQIKRMMLTLRHC